MKKNSFPYPLHADTGDLLTINPSLMTHFTQWSRSFLCVLSICVLAQSKLNAQVALTATGGTATGSYTTLSAAFAAINAGTHQGAIAITITGTTTEPVGAAGSAILVAGNTGGTANYSSVRVTPSGAATITGAATAGYALIDFLGADNVTIDGLNTGGNSLTISNTTVSPASGTSTIRFFGDATTNTIQKCTILGSSTTPLATNGGTIYFATALTTGNDNNTISNCDIAAAGTNLPSKAIYSNGTTTSATHANSGISITGCNIYDYFLTSGCAGVYALAGNTQWSMTNNKVYQTAARTFTAAGTMYGLYFSNSTFGEGITMTGNTIGFANNAGTGTLTLTGATFAGSFQGLYLGALSTATLACNLNNNTISDISLTSSTGSFTGILNVSSASSNTININNNNIKNISLLTSTGFIYGISWGSATNSSVSNNTVDNLSKNTNGTTYGIYSFSNSVGEAINNNVVSNLVNTYALTSSITIRGIYQFTTTGTKEYKNNRVFNLSAAGTGTSNIVEGIRVTSGTTLDISGNTIYGFSGTGTTVTGLGVAVTLGNIHKNKVYGLTSTHASATISGISLTATTSNAYNNMIGDLQAPAANVAVSITGINIGGTTSNLYNNTVYLNATSAGAAFGTSALYATATAMVRLNNNLLVNNSTPMGATGFTTVFRRGGAYSASVYDPLSNNNAFYAGIPSATNLIFYDGTVSNPTLASYKALVTPFDASSVTTNPTWVSTNSSSANYLHIPSGSALNILESNGVNIPLFNTDFDGDSRPGPLASVNGGGTAYDIGADEFDGAPAVPRVNAVSIDIPTTQCVARARTITATVTPINPLTAVTLYYTINGANPRAVVMTGGDPGVASNWMGTIPAASPTNGMVAWYVEATDGIYSGSKLGTVYNDDPLAGVVVTAAATPATVCATTATSITANFRPTTPIGAGAVASSTTGITPFAGAWGGTKTQYLIRASELFASGFLPVSNTITSLTINCTTSGQAYPNLAIAMGNTSTASMTSTFISGSSDVYSNANYTPVVGANTFTFTTPFTWDGVSNIVITFCWTNPTASTATASTVKSDVTTFASALPHQADQVTAAVLCGATASTRATVSSRPQFTLNNTPVLNYVWTDGGGANMGNTRTITPIVNANTTYNVRITNPQGCLLTGSTAVATVPFPTTPTAAPTTQCGTRVPTCRATSTTGAATPTFRWYLVSADGTPLVGETGATLRNYSIARTTTFFVAEYNGVCESNRVPITVTVTTPELLTVSANTTGCNNEPVGLQVTSPIGNFNTYVWSPAAGLFTDAAGTTAYVAGASAAQVYAKSSTAGATTYTCNSANALCTNSQTSVVSVLPTSITASVAGAAQFCTSGSATLSIPTAPAGGILQWQESPDNSSWLDASGANAAIYNAPSITQTRYYRLAVRKTGGSNCLVSNTLTISVTSPTVGAPVNATKCGPGAVTLGVTGNFGIINWFKTPTGGTSLGTGTSYTPTVDTIGTTPFYAESSIIAGTYEAMGNDTASVPATTGASAERGIVFRADKSFLLVSAQYYSPTLSVTNTVTVRLLNDADGTVLNTVTLPIVQGANAGWYTMNMNFDIAAGRTYRLLASFSSAVNRVNTGVDFTTAAFNNLRSLGTIIGGYDGLLSPTTYSYFHNISAIEICKSARQAVNAVVTTPPALTLSSVTPATCAGTPTTAVTVTSAIGDYSNYTWSPATGVTGTTSAVFNPAQTTTYTLSANQATGDFCQNKATVTVTVNPLPTTPIISPATATLCTGGAAVQLAALTTSAPQKIGTPGASNGTTSYPAPYNNYFGGAKHQLLFTAAELRAAGLLTGSPIKSIKFTVTGVGTTFTGSLQDFHLKVGHTTLTALTTTFETGLTQVVAPSVVPITVGDIEHNFSTPFVWDGTSNLILETSYSNANVGVSTDNVQTEMTNSLSFDACSYYRTDGATSSAVATTTTATGTSTSRPNVTFTTLVGCNWQALTTGLYTDAAATTPYVSGNIASVYAKPAATTTYTATGVSLAGCTATATRTVTISALPTPAIANNRPLTFCPGDSTVLTASGGATYMWSNGETSASITAKTAGVYKVKVANAAGCMDSTMVTVALSARPTVAIANNRPTTFCVGDSTLLTASGGATYAWSTGAASAGITARTAGTYKVTVTNAAGCVDSSMVAITTNARPTAAIAGATAICAGDSTVFTASGGANYAWSNAATSASINVKTAGTYRVTVTNAAGCVDTTSRTLTVNTRPSAGLSVTGVSTFCQGDSAILRARNGVTYRWTTPAGVRTDSVVVAKTSGIYKVLAFNAAGCADSVDITITVNPKPVVSFTATSLGGNATFTNTSTNGSTYSWNFGDTTNLGTTANTTHAYRYNGTYTVKLIVTSASGCRDSITNTITITRVGNNEVLKNVEALVYPNPTSDNFFIEFRDLTLNLRTGDYVSVTDALGREIHRQTINGHRVEIITENWAAGLYMIQAVIGNQKAGLGKIVKMSK